MALLRRERARRSFANFALMLPERREGIRLLGTSGTVTTLASVHLALPSYDRRAVDGLHVPIEAMQKISSMISGMDYEERSCLPCIGSERADLVVAGCAILEAIMEIWPARNLGVADRVGSIAKGRDADLVFLSAEPFAPGAAVRRVMVNGEFVFERKEADVQTYRAVRDSSGKGREVRWRKVPARTASGYTELSTLLRPNAGVVAYALTFLQADAETRVDLGLGTPGAFRLWVNGIKAASSDAYHPPQVDQARVQVKLRKGVNRVLLKLCHDTGPLGFYFRYQRSEGAPVSAKVWRP